MDENKNNANSYDENKIYFAKKKYTGKAIVPITEDEKLIHSPVGLKKVPTTPKRNDVLKSSDKSNRTPIAENGSNKKHGSNKKPKVSSTFSDYVWD